MSTNPLALVNVARQLGVDLPTAMLMLGAAFEFRWFPKAVPAGGKVYARAAVSSNKYLLLTRREVSMELEKGLYRAYAGAPAGTPGASIDIIKARADSPVGTEVTGNFETAPDLTGLSPVAELPLYGQKPGVFILPAGAGTPVTDPILRVYPPGTIFTIELFNQSQDPSDMYLNLSWWEVSPQFMPTPRGV